MKRIVTLVALLACFSLSSVAQRLMQCRGAVKGSYNFWFYSPGEKNFITTEREGDKLLVVFLHGASLCGNNMDRVRRYGTIHALEKGLDLDAYVVAPQNSGGAWNPSKLWKIVEWAKSICPIDDNRIYVFGMSLGGYGAIDFANAYADKIAATIAMCGGGTGNNFDNLSQMPLWLIHGTADRAVGLEQSARIARAVGDERLKFTKLKGGNHGTPARIFYMKKAYDWLFEHRLDDEERPICRDYDISMGDIRNAYDGLDMSRGKGGLKTTVWRPDTFGFNPEPGFEPASIDPAQVNQDEETPRRKVFHKIRKGETLAVLAKRYHTTVDKLCKLNKLKKTSRLDIGQKVRVK
ncbi:MAG: LysM peptidoglycan-binding domain-containing protein [Bacteroidaceae bacterium]|nr:LysM peptidoglycan-binding domain-containing protein [Bacteroidaceae bacterium]